MIKYCLITLILCSIITSRSPPRRVNRLKRIRKHYTSYVFNNQAAWPILCENTAKGNVPGKLDDKGGAYYPWGGKEHVCGEWKPIRGALVSSTNEIPENCDVRGFQTNDNRKYYNAVIKTDQGLIPGKAAWNLSMAWYSWGGLEIYVREDFFVIC